MALIMDLRISVTVIAVMQYHSDGLHTSLLKLGFLIRLRRRPLCGDLMGLVYRVAVNIFNNHLRQLTLVPRSIKVMLS